MTCEHPKECMQPEVLLCGETTDDVECAWCKQVYSLERDVRNLENAVGKTAITIKGGDVQLECGDVGLLQMRGGNLRFTPKAPAVLITRRTTRDSPQPTAPEPSGCEVRFKFKPGDIVEFYDNYHKVQRATVTRMSVDNHLHKAIRVAWKCDDNGVDAVWIDEGNAWWS